MNSRIRCSDATCTRLGRHYHHLTRDQRYLIQRHVGNGKTQLEIAVLLGVAPSTISRELNRNSNSSGSYLARSAHSFALSRKPHPTAYRRPKIQGALELMIAEKLSQGWSPEQISQRLKLEDKPSVSHEAIYRYIFMMKRAGGEFHRALRRFGRRKLKRGVRRRKRYPWVEPRKFLDQRPAEANERTELGHWERDLVIGRQDEGVALLTIIDRKSRLTLLRKVRSKSAHEVTSKTCEALRAHGGQFRSMSNDNGPEMGQFVHLEKELQIPVYFAQPHSPWQRGSVENLNGLLRQFFPKRRTQFKDVSDEDVAFVQSRMNSRPRKVLGFKTPEEIHFKKEIKLFKSIRHYEQEIRRELEQSYASGCPCCRSSRNCT